MSDFKREARYYVIKQKNLTEDQDIALCDILSGAQIPCTDCVVVEKDWQNYEHTWKTIERVASGKFYDPYEEIDGLNLHIEHLQARLESVHNDLLEIHRVTAHVAGWTGEPLREDHLTVRRVKEISIWLNRTVQELEQSRARVAELETGMASAVVPESATSFSVRGFQGYKLLDFYGHEFSLQKSSLATEDCLWFGLNNANPLVLHGDAKRLGVKTTASSGWVTYPLPEEVNLNTRMHLSREQVAELIPALQHFVATGDLPKQEQGQ